MFAEFCSVLLALSSLTAAAEPSCEELTKPLQDWTQISGKWIYHVGTSDNEEKLNQRKTVSSSWIVFSAGNESDGMTLHWGDKINGQCWYLSGNTSLMTDDTLKVTFNFNSTTLEHVGKHLVTCPDSLLWVDESVGVDKNGESKKARNLYLFTKTGTLDAAHLEHFKRQAACLDFPPEFHFGDATDLCPDDKDAKEGEQ